MKAIQHRTLDRLKEVTHPSVRRWLVGKRLAMRGTTAKFRVLPDFLIIGAQRSGTSSLYKYLGRHPHVAPSLRKETGYFSSHHDKGENWYRAHFPLAARGAAHRRLHGMNLLSFEATPDYLFDPRTPLRVSALLPDARFVVLLRNPVDRAYSHYLHMQRLRFEDLAFDEALDAEELRLQGDPEDLDADPDHQAKSWSRYSYVARGRYAQQLLRWWEQFDRDRFLIIRSEDFFESPGRILAEITDFVGVDRWLPETFANYSYVGASPSIPDIGADLRAQLQSVFKEDNEHLAELLGRDMGWDV